MKRKIRRKRLMIMNKTRIAAVVTAMMMAATPMTAFAYYDEPDTEEIEIVSEGRAYETDDKEEESKVVEETEEAWGPLTPDGNMELVDDYGSIEAGGKQFVTVTTKNGNYFYLIIDRDDDGNETVHFLNQVDEADLLALMDEEEVEGYQDSKEVVEEEVVPEEPEETEEIAETPKKNKKLNGIMSLILIGTIGGIAVFFYFKNTKKKKTSKTDGIDPDLDYEEEDFFDSIPQEEDDGEEGNQK